MALEVNEQAWGNVAEWTKNTSTTGDYFTYPWSRRNWNNIYSAGHQTINQDIDLTIAPWRINKRSALVDLWGNYWYNDWHDQEGAVIDASETNRAHHTIQEVIERKNVPFILSYLGGSGTSYDTTWTKYWAYKFEVGSKTDTNVGGNRFPVANFRYDKIRICPMTWWIAADPEDMTTNRPTPSQVGGLPNAEILASKPYCVGIGFRIFIDKNGTWTEVPMTIDINTHFLGDGSTEEWYATESGMYTMRMPLMLNYAGTHYNNMFFGEAITNNYNTQYFSRGSERAKIAGFSRSSYDAAAVQGIGSIISGDFEGFKYNQKMAKPNNPIFSGFQYKMFSSTDELRELIKRELAYIGLPFVMSSDLVSTASLDSNNLYLPVFDANRCTTGQWRTGAEARELPNASWTWIYSIDPLPEDKDDGGDDEDKDSGDLNNHASNYRRYANPNAVYALTEQNFLNFINDVNGLYLSDPDDKQLKLDFKGSNPNEYIVGCYGIPFLANYRVPSATDGDIELGPITLPTAKGVLVDTDTTIVRDCGTITIPRKYSDFRDYEPYTQIELYVPLCGSIKLDPAFVIGHQIGVEVYYDILTMSATAAVYRYSDLGVTLINTINGSIGATLPVTASAMGSYQNSIKLNENALKQNQLKTGTAIATTAIGVVGAALAPETGGLSLAAAGAAIAGASAIASTLGKSEMINYDLKHKQPDISECSSSNGAVAQWISDMRPWVFIKRAVTLPHDDSIYSRTVGNACCINAKIGSVSGKTICSNIDTNGIPATVEEINAIKQAFARGVIV